MEELFDLTKKALVKLESEISLKSCCFESEKIRYLYSKREECLHLLLALETIIGAENKFELLAFDKALNNGDRQVERCRTADKVMKMLLDTKMISPFAYSEYLVQCTVHCCESKELK
jgi:hypothetical protein